MLARNSTIKELIDEKENQAKIISYSAWQLKNDF